ncbi:MAG: carboxypeptidase regulatory-like domain-containing protein [Lewinellaceae bacterium]|nr:carboxypeptidase regulatory-like domain-containing protein [Lewinellaceae bacterium]
MARYLLLILSCCLLGSTAIIAQTSLYGKITEKESGDVVIGANVVLKKNGVFETGSDTDFDGNYSITNLDPGTYDVEVSYVGFPTQRITDVVIAAGKGTRLDVALEAEGIELNTVIVTGYKVPLIDKDNTSTGGFVTAEQIQKLPSKSINAIVANVAGTSSADEGDDVTIKGSRSNATVYFLDGIRVSGNLPPQTEVEQLQVITGGVEAQYGDVTGGVISVTTKGPSQRFTGGFEVETSGLQLGDKYVGLDPYGYNLLVANLSGPIVKNSKGESILGFRISGQYLDRLDDDPPAIPVYRVKDDVLAELEANPVLLVGNSLVPAAEFLTSDDVNEMSYQPYERNNRIDLTGKLDARLAKGLDVSVTGTYYQIANQFTPNAWGTAMWNVYNSHNNPTENDLRYRVNVRLRHRLGTGGGATDADAVRKGAGIQNASYTLQAGFERQIYDLADPRHQDRFFDYGYVGKFDYEWVNVLGSPIDPSTWNYPIPLQHRDFRQVFTGYTPGDVNPVLANYNNVLEDITGVDAFVADNGFISQLYSRVWNLHANVGSVYNLYRKRDNQTLTFTANTSFEIVPKYSDKGRHNVQVGIWYEQRTQRGYDLSPTSLWQIARQQANRNILGVDTANQVGDTLVLGTLLPIYGTLTTDLEDLLFYKNVRDAIGVSSHDFVNVDGLSPDQLSLDMFSSRELTGENILNYWGYDYLGNQIDATFEDFFTAKDANGVRTFPVGAFSPIYTSAWIQDKFTYKDIIFRVGLRVDRFDANTKVLKDPYALYEIMSAKDFYDNFGGNRPASIGDDFKVYVDSDGSSVVKAYRNGDQWYSVSGTEVNNPTQIFGGELVFPRYTVEDPNIQSRDFDPSISFQDYEQQTNFMPRLAFSFPISNDANFFAHYDVLVQRPPSDTLASPLDYFYFQERTGVRNNPALRPERTIDYEVGFQQKLSASSALKIAAYYKELRDMIQRRTFLYVAAPINQYDTYDNLDFGTVKGFTFQYDLRRTGNISLQAAYTLQFADGTGSDANSSGNLSSRGIQRVLYPLNFDERHRFNLSLDYRYGSGKRYTGPRVFGFDLLANTGLNMQAIAVSGRPYTAKLVPVQFDGQGTVGSINGARLPWNFTINARVDRDIYLTSPDAARPLMVNVYFRVSNLLNRKNIINVYSATGSPSDDGYLASSKGLDALDATLSTGRTDAYLASYQWRMLNPNFYSLPRRMYLGLIFNF